MNYEKQGALVLCARLQPSDKVLTLPTLHLTVIDGGSSERSKKMEHEAQRMLLIGEAYLEQNNIPKAAWKKEDRQFLSDLYSIWKNRFGDYENLPVEEIIEALRYIHEKGRREWIASRLPEEEVTEISIQTSDLLLPAVEHTNKVIGLSKHRRIPQKSPASAELEQAA